MNSVLFESISLESAEEIARKAIAYARNQKMKPIAVSVLDVRGTLKAYLAEDGTSLLRIQIAFGKAWGCLGMGLGGRDITARNARIPGFINALQAMCDGNIVPVPGGMLIRNEKGTLLGAVGISGETSDNDELCGLHAIEEVGLQADLE